jgi:hypothetical protein
VRTLSISRLGEPHAQKRPARGSFEVSADLAMKRMTHAAAGARSESSLVPLAMFYSDWDAPHVALVGRAVTTSRLQGAMELVERRK